MGAIVCDTKNSMHAEVLRVDQIRDPRSGRVTAMAHIRNINGWCYTVDAARLRVVRNAPANKLRLVISNPALTFVPGDIVYDRQGRLCVVLSTITALGGKRHLDKVMVQYEGDTPDTGPYDYLDPRDLSFDLPRTVAGGRQ